MLKSVRKSVTFNIVQAIWNFDRYFRVFFYNEFVTSLALVICTTATMVYPNFGNLSATSEMQTAITDLLEAMDATLATFERCSNGTVDSTRTSIDLQNAEEDLSEMRQRIRDS
jgi:hypothetical protein